MMFYKYFFFIIIFVNVIFANDYKIDLVTDKNSKIYIEKIKNEVDSLMPKSNKILYNISLCNDDCDKYIDTTAKILLIQTPKKLQNMKNTSVITYNFILSNYDESKIIRAVSLAIYELLEKKKSNSFYIENQKFTNNENEKNSEATLLNLKNIYTLIDKNNLEIQQNNNSAILSALGIDEAKSNYKPQINIYSNYTKIDSDRAQFSNGLYSEKTQDIGLKLSQIIYSNQALKNIEIKKLLANSTKDETKALNDEIFYRATLIYLNIIKLKKATKIIKIKHNFIVQNLEFANQRFQIGVQDKSDIYRWESELSNVNIELSNSKKELNSLKIELSNLLGIDDDFDLFEYDLSSSLFKLNNMDAINIISNKEIQTNFVNEIIYSHSRLKQLNNLKNVKKEELQMNKESRYMPTIAFEASARKILDRNGAGANFARPWDDEEYQAVLNINFPLYEGGLKSNKIEKNKIELINLKLQYDNIKNLIIENVSKNYESLNSSYEKIKYAIKSEESSKKNFELIEDKYKKGKESIIPLLDAQNTYIISKLNLNILKTDYLSDLSSIYFFTGQMDILIDENKKRQLEENSLKILKGNEK